jgi:soluble lytic murein transglycosylase-like protein
MKHSRTVLLLACASLAGEFLCHTLGFHTPIQTVEHIFPRWHAPEVTAVAEVKPVRKPPLKLQPDQARALITHAAREHRVPAALVKSIMAAESNFDCNALSDKGAVGLMQLMPETAAEYGADPEVPEQNVRAGAGYLRALLDRYSKKRDCLKRTIAAYNAGPGNVDKYRGIPPFKETRDYVKRVMAYFHEFSKETGERVASAVHKQRRSTRLARSARSGRNG